MFVQVLYSIFFIFIFFFFFFPFLFLHCSQAKEEFEEGMTELAVPEGRLVGVGLKFPVIIILNILELFTVFLTIKNPKLH